jgi:hypothetical protein
VARRRSGAPRSIDFGAVEGEGRTPERGGVAPPWERRAAGERLGTSLTGGPRLSVTGNERERRWAGCRPNWATGSCWAVRGERDGWAGGLLQLGLKEKNKGEGKQGRAKRKEKGGRAV